MTRAKRMARRKPATRPRNAGRAGATPPAADPAADDVRLLARDAALAALTRLAELAGSKDERVALAASQELLNRAFGKSISAIADDQANAAQPLVIKIVRFGAADADEPRPPSGRGARP